MMRTWTLNNLKSDIDHQRRDALDEIVYSGDPLFIPPLMELLVSDPLFPTPYETSVALQGFGATIVPLLLETLKSSDSRTRFHTSLVLRELKDDRTTRPLIMALESDPDVDVRRVAAQALGGIRDQRAFVPLVHALDRDPAIAAFATRALARLGDPQEIRSWMEEMPDLQDIDGKLLRIQSREHGEHREEARHIGDPKLTADCSVCGASLPRLSTAGVRSSWRYGGAFCARCHSKWCPDCQPSETERGQHRRCGGPMREFPINRQTIHR